MAASSLCFFRLQLSIVRQSTHCPRSSYALFQNVRNFSETHTETGDRCDIITRESKVDQQVAEELVTKHVGVSGHINYRRHAGIMRRTRSSLPTRLVKAINVMLEKYPVPSLMNKTDQLVKYLFQRQPPLGDAELSQRARDIEAKMFEEDGDKFEGLTGEELEEAHRKHRNVVLAKLRRNVYHWKPMSYDAFTSYIYLLGRIASDYAAQLQCFTEISKRDPDFKPTSVFYHGSRVGAGVWASNEIWQNIGEHYCVDECVHMNTIARLLLQDGNEQHRVMSISGTHFRNFAPSPKQNDFSMVVCAYNLMEQPSFDDRIQLITDLWEMTNSYLVFIEVGTGAGFKLVDEAKQFIQQISIEVGPEHSLHGHVFAPCPHDKPCPKVRVKNQPCLTECAMKNVDFTKKTTPEKPKSNLRYSYVIMKKGPRQSDTAWPRILQRSKAQRHTHCHLCLPSGDMQHVVISKAKHEKHLYSCARYVDQGDFLPVSLTPSSSQSNNTQTSQRESGVVSQHNGSGGSQESESITTPCDRSHHSTKLSVDS